MDQRRLNVVQDMMSFIKRENILSMSFANRGPLTLVFENNKHHPQETWHVESIAKEDQIFLNLWKELKGDSVRAQLNFKSMKDCAQFGSWKMVVSDFNSERYYYDKFSVQVDQFDEIGESIQINEALGFKAKGVLGTIFSLSAT